MKKLSVLIIVAVAAFAAFMTSCDKEPVNVAAPTITFITQDTSIASGEGITIKGDIYAPGNIGTITYYKNGEVYGTPITSGFDSDTTTYFEVQISNVTEAFTFKVEVEDLQNEPKSTMSEEITIGLGGPVDKATAIKLYSAPEGLTVDQSCFTALRPSFTTYNWETAQANQASIHLLYYNGNYTKASIPHFVSADTETQYAHGGAALTGATTTHFAVLTGDDAALFSEWSSIDTDNEINAITAAINSVNVTWTDVAGTIIAFELEDGRKGVIKVGACVDGNTDGDFYDATIDYIEFDVIVQQNAPVTK